MRLNKITNHAIRILSACAQGGEDLKKAGILAAELDLTHQNTVKIIHVLTRAGFLQSTRGRNGGVQLALPAEKIYIGAVVREIEAGLGDDALQEEKPSDGFGVLVDDAFAAFLEVLDGQTLADLVTAPGKINAKKTKQSVRKTNPVHRLNVKRKPSLPRNAGKSS